MTTPNMILNVMLVRTPKLTMITFVRLLTSMYLHMALQMLTAVRRILTQLTLESFHTSVLAHVVA